MGRLSGRTAVVTGGAKESEGIIHGRSPPRCDRRFVGASLAQELAAVSPRNAYGIPFAKFPALDLQLSDRAD
jgi:hypothetical protein